MHLINYRLWAAVSFLMFLPACYATTRVYFLTSLPDTGTISIAAQAAWLHLAFEVASEAILMPLYFVLGAVATGIAALRHRISAALRLTVLVYGVLVAVGWFCAHSWVVAMAVPEPMQTITAQFLRLEALGQGVQAIGDLALVVVVVLGRHRIVTCLAMAKTTVVIALDTVLVGTNGLALGVMGVAYTNLIASVLFSLLGLWFLWRWRLLAVAPHKPRQNVRQAGQQLWRLEWHRIAVRAGFEAFVRNAAFAVMILRLVNQAQSADVYWLANTFVWSWLLLPVLSLGTVIRQDAGRRAGQLGVRWRAYLSLTVVITTVWLLTIPFWHAFVSGVMGYEDAQAVVDVLLVLLVFYTVFAFNSALDSYFYGIGRTDLLLQQTLVVSLGYYGSAFAAYHLGLFQPDLHGIAVMFGMGIVLDGALTLWQFRRRGYDQQLQPDGGIAIVEPPKERPQPQAAQSVPILPQ